MNSLPPPIIENLSHQTGPDRIMSQASADSLLKVNEKLSRANSETSSSFSPNPYSSVGLPRSGSTLVESILSRAPEIQDLGEIRALERSIELVETEGDSKDISLETIRSDYLRHTRNLQETATLQLEASGLRTRCSTIFNTARQFLLFSQTQKIIHTFRNLTGQCTVRFYNPLWQKKTSGLTI